MDARTERSTRLRIIALLRRELSRRAANDKSICKLAAEQGVFCRGFARFSETELRGTYEWIVRFLPHLLRDQLEEIADRWQIARQASEQVPTSCDVQQKLRRTCAGWDDFSTEELFALYREMKGA
jgi:hypothetical protein